jgi:hypothetical protein
MRPSACFSYGLDESTENLTARRSVSSGSSVASTDSGAEAFARRASLVLLRHSTA